MISLCLQRQREFSSLKPESFVAVHSERTWSAREGDEVFSHNSVSHALVFPPDRMARSLLAFPCREAKEEELKRKEAVLRLKEQEIHEHHVKVRQVIYGVTMTRTCGGPLCVPPMRSPVPGLSRLGVDSGL